MIKPKEFSYEIYKEDYSTRHHGQLAAEAFSWEQVFDLCYNLGMELEDNTSGIEDVFSFIQTLKEKNDLSV